MDSVRIASSTLASTTSTTMPPGPVAAGNLRKRAKPLLGTVVEIAVLAGDNATFVDATDAAFARVADIHRAMSFHEGTSDLAAIANAEAGAKLRIFSDTWKTLSLAIEVERLSNGLFNPTVAPTLVRRGMLPRPDASKLKAATDYLESALHKGDLARQQREGRTVYRRLNRFECNRRRRLLGLGRERENGNLDLCSQNLQLLDGGRTIDVTRHHHGVVGRTNQP